MKYDFADIKSQMKFCAELVLRLNEDIQSAKPHQYFPGMDNRYQKHDDIKRIRREFLRLSKMLNPYRDGR